MKSIQSRSLKRSLGLGFALGTGTLALQGLTAALCLSFLLPLAPPPLSMGPVPAALAEGKTLVRFRSFDNSIFAEAKRDNKFVLLDLEAVWCHWCHVMDEKTYGNEAVADLLNSRFICVKVDQDAQPDLSVKYEDYGWPATIIFDGDGREIVKRSGYINPEKMKALLEAIIKDPSPEEAQPPSSSLSPASAAEPNAGADSKSRGDSAAKSDAKDGLSETLRQDLLDKHLQGYDAKYGAWGTYQKFLDWDSVEYSMLIGLGKDQSDARSYQERARKTLDGELNLLDPAFGGVYQYSTDGDWKHAHFEKTATQRFGPGNADTDAAGLAKLGFSFRHQPGNGRQGRPVVALRCGNAPPQQLPAIGGQPDDLDLAAAKIDPQPHQTRTATPLTLP